jgi:NAD(P)H dehydrogenase (quinone)
MTIVVTGATGQLGRLTVEALLRRGTAPADVVATGRDVDRIADLAERGVTVRHADFADPGTLPAAFAGADRLLLVSTTTVGERLDNHRRALEAARTVGVGQVVYTSALNAGTARMRLAEEHRGTEQLLRESGLPGVVLRNGWYLENHTDLLPLVLATGTVQGSAGDGRVSSASRADYADAAAVVLTTDGHTGATYELGGDEDFSLPELAAAIARLSGQPVRYADLPVDEYAAVLTGLGLPPALAEVLADADAGLARGELQTTSDDLRRLIGRPTTTLEQALSAARTAEAPPVH